MTANPALAGLSVSFTPATGVQSFTDISADVLQSDGWTFSRGRQYETDTIEPGTGSIVLTNTTGQYTQSNAAGPYYPYVRPRRQALLKVSDGTVTAQLATCRVARWPVGWPGGAGTFSTVAAQLEGADSALRRQGSLLTALSEEILADGALGFWPLTDAQGSSVGADQSGNNAPGAVPMAYGATGTAPAVFGGQSLTAESGSSATLKGVLDTGSGTNAQGAFLLIGGPAPCVPSAGGWSFEMVFAMTATAGNTDGVILWEQFDTAGNTITRFVVTPTDTSFLVGSTMTAYADRGHMDGLPHHVIGTLSADRKTLTMYIDGMLATGVTTTINPAVSATAIVSGTPAGIDLGGSPHAGPGQDLNAFPDASLGYVATYAVPLNAARVASHAAAVLGFAGETANTRIARVLGYASWPVTAQALDAGIDPLGPQALAGTDALTACQDAAAADSGYVFLRSDGKLAFHNRDHRLNAASTWTLDCLLQHIGADLAFDYDDQRLENVTDITSASGPVQRVTNPASRAEYGDGQVSVTINVLDPRSAMWAGLWRQLHNSAPRYRLGRISVNWQADPSLRASAFAVEIGDLITLTNLPVTAPATTMSFFVEKITHAGSATTGLLTMEVSPAEPATYLRADAAASAFTKLDAGLIIAY